MLEGLKADIAKEAAGPDPIGAQMGTSADDRLKDAMLEDFSLSTLGADNDTSLDPLINQIPEYNDGDPETEEELERALEAVIPTEFK